MIAIIDYGVGNLKSVEKAFRFLGYNAVTTADCDIIRSAKAVVLPGVGAISDAMKQLKQNGIDKSIYDICSKNIPFLGICLGLQMLYDNSEEGGNVSGLGILSGKITKIPDNNGLKVPQMGWNSIKLQNNSEIFKGIKDETYVYFVHSYYLSSKDLAEVTAVTEYGVSIAAAVQKGNVFATQFHPEKSGKVGLTILDNFAKNAGANKNDNISGN